MPYCIYQFLTITNIEIQCFLGKKCIGLKKLFTQHIIGDHIIQSQIDYKRLSKWVDIKAIKIGLFRKAPLLFIHIQKVGSNVCHILRILILNLCILLCQDIDYFTFWPQILPAIIE